MYTKFGLRVSFADEFRVKRHVESSNTKIRKTGLIVCDGERGSRKLGDVFSEDKTTSSRQSEFGV